MLREIGSQNIALVPQSSPHRSGGSTHRHCQNRISHSSEQWRPYDRFFGDVEMAHQQYKILPERGYFKKFCLPVSLDMPTPQFSKRERKFRKLIRSESISRPLNIGRVISICGGFTTNEGRISINFRETWKRRIQASDFGREDLKFEILKSLSEHQWVTPDTPSRFPPSFPEKNTRTEFYRHRSPPLSCTVIYSFADQRTISWSPHPRCNAQSRLNLWNYERNPSP